MAQYKVPQDVEADDKLIGPFSFRQFVYLLIVAGLVGLAFALFQLFPILVIIPVPFILFFAVLALPLKKDQPMETYLAAVVSFYLKPRTRLWTPGQRESTIKITAPKIVEDNRTRSISGEEATHRLSFLAELVDTEGYAIRGGSGPMRDDLAAEAATATDIFETHRFNDLGSTIRRDEDVRHEEVMQKMRSAIAANETTLSAPTVIRRSGAPDLKPTTPSSPTNTAVVRPTNPSAGPSVTQPPAQSTAIQTVDMKPKSVLDSPVVVLPNQPVKANPPRPASVPSTSSRSNTTAETPENPPSEPPKPSIIELANNPDFSVETIAKQAKRIKRKEAGEVFISLH